MTLNLITKRKVTDIKDCAFYHTTDLPEHGEIKGKWDLRNGTGKYLGNLNFKGKKILEFGPASGFLSFYMEKEGASVLSYDIGDDVEWDVVPFSQYDHTELIEPFFEYNNQMKNAYWFSHDALQSKNKAYYGNIYNLPNELGEFDIVTFCSILLHLRDPFKALYEGALHAKEKILITDLAEAPTVFSKNEMYDRSFIGRVKNACRILFNKDIYQFTPTSVPYLQFLPDFTTLAHKDAWWYLSPKLVINMLGVLGFEETEVQYHEYELNGRPTPTYSVVGTRTKSPPRDWGHFLKNS